MQLIFLVWPPLTERWRFEILRSVLKCDVTVGCEGLKQKTILGSFPLSQDTAGESWDQQSLQTGGRSQHWQY